MTQEALESAREAFRIESEAVAALWEVMDTDAFARAVEVLAKAPRIAASGCGHSGIACRHFAHLMCCIEPIPTSTCFTATGARIGPR